MNWKKILLSLIAGFAAVFVLFPALLLGLFLLGFVTGGEGKVTVTTDLADYGVISGNYDNEYPAEFMFSFFPEEISEDFSDVRYQYTAQKGDAYACEIWLEFDIEDEEKFADFLASSVIPEEVTAFAYDPTLSDYTIANSFILTWPEKDEPGDIHIEYAKIGKILYDEETQHIIFFALLMYDGGFSSTEVFGSFFTRFGIDPIQYEIDAYDDTYYIEDGVTHIR